jgi:hypothetical protein
MEGVASAVVRLLLAFDVLIRETGEVDVYRTGFEVVGVVVVEPGAPGFASREISL